MVRFRFLLIPFSVAMLLAVSQSCARSSLLSESTAPLTLRLSLQKGRLFVGEAIAIDVAVQPHADLEMETVELNANRTRINITDRTGQRRVLTGQDYATLHHHAELQDIGRAFRAASGKPFSSVLDLFLYTRPLAPGHYRAEISYRYGNTDEAVVHSNPIEFDIVPTRIEFSTHRWFGGESLRQELASVWAARDREKLRWFYQLANPNDPGAVLGAADLNLSIPPGAVPQLAQLNDSSAAHFERYLVWIDSDRVAWVPVQPSGRTRDPMYVPHTLMGEPRLVDAPLQTSNGGLRLLLVGTDMRGHPAASLIEVGEGGDTKRRVVTLDAIPQQSVVRWKDQDGAGRGTLFYIVDFHNSGDKDIHVTELESGRERRIRTTPYAPLALIVDQLAGSGRILAALRNGETLLVKQWDADTLTVVKESSIRLPAATVALQQLPVGAEVMNRNGDLILLFRDANSWTIIGPEVKQTLAVGETSEAQPEIAATPQAGVFLIFRTKDSGFDTIRLPDAKK